MKARTKWALLVLILAAVFVGCASISGDIELAEAIIKDIVEAEPAIKELVKLAKDVVKDLQDHHAQHHDPNALPHTH